MLPEPQPGLRDPLRLNRYSLVALAALVLVVATLATVRFDLALAEWNALIGGAGWRENMDWLLAGLGVFFLLCTVFGPDPSLDLATVAAGVTGGAIIETWGTRADVWHYYTFERPPLWILPAWGMSALANERLQKALMEFIPEGWRERILTDPVGSPAARWAYGLVMPALVAFYLWWSRFFLFHPATWVVTALIVLALRNPKFPGYALSLFFTGALLGIFLEIWGTTRHCWNYYDGKTPSPFPILGHGVAAICFWKIKSAARAAWAQARRLVWGRA